MAERTAEQVRTALKNQLIVYDPTFEDPNEQFRQIVGGALGSRRMTREEVAQAAGIPVEQLTKLEPGLDLGSNERTALYQQYITPGRSTGFFSSLLGGVGGVVGGLTNAVADPVANALNVHPDAVKAAAALAGMYYAGGGTFFDTATNAVIPEAAATDIVAATLSAEGLAAPAAISTAAPAAGATLGAAELAALDAGFGGLPAAAAPLATAFPVATAPLATMGAPTPMLAAELAALDAGLGGLPTLAPNAVAPVTAVGPTFAGYGGAGNALAGGAFTGSTLPAAATTFPAATAPMATYTAAELAALDAGLGGVSANALAPAAATAAAAGTAALSPEALAALDAGLGGVSSGAGAATSLPALASTAVAPASAVGPTLAGYGGAGDVLNPVTGAVTTGADAATGLTGAAGAATNALAGYGGAGDVLNPATGAVITGADAAAAGLSASAFDTLAKFAKDYGVPLSSLISGITGAQAASNAADVQAQSAREARDLAKQIYEKQVSLQEPFRTAGITAQNQLLTLLGLQGGTPGAEFGRYARPFGMSDFQADPGYAFRLSEGMKALEASRAAKGGLLSGATGKALSRYGQDLASQEYGNAFNRFQTERVNRLQPLGSLMSTGQAAASNQGAAAGQYGTTAGNLTTDIGAAQAAGGIGSANAITNALNQYARYASGQNVANQIRQSMYGAAIPG